MNQWVMCQADGLAPNHPEFIIPPRWTLRKLGRMEAAQVSQKLRRCITVPIFVATCVYQLVMGYLYLVHRISDAAIWRAGKLTFFIVLALILTEWSMNDPGNGNQRGFDVLPPKE